MSEKKTDAKKKRSEKMRQTRPMRLKSRALFRQTSTRRAFRSVGVGGAEDVRSMSFRYAMGDAGHQPLAGRRPHFRELVQRAGERLGHVVDWDGVDTVVDRPAPAATCRDRGRIPHARAREGGAR